MEIYGPGPIFHYSSHLNRPAVGTTQLEEADYRGFDDYTSQNRGL
jgi:hypothetical protein